MSTQTLPPTPVAAPFQALDAEHQQIAAHLERLAGLAEYLDMNGVDERSRAEAAAIEAFFSSTAQPHHVREEQQVFPALLAGADEHLAATVRMLRQDHGWIEQDWLELAPQLRAIASGYSWFEPAELRHGLNLFVELCREHIVLEESVVYPAAREHVAALQRRREAAGPLRFTRAAPSSS